MIMELVVDKFLLYIVNKHQCNLFTMCSFFNSIFTVTGNNNTMCSKNRIGNRNFNSKLLIIVFHINSISLVESEELRKPGTWKTKRKSSSNRKANSGLHSYQIILEPIY